MQPLQNYTAKQACEQILIEEKRYNIEHRILPSEVAVADRLLARGVELTEAYDELYRKLHQRIGALPAFLQVVLNTAAFWNLDDIAAARTARRDLEETNLEIARKSAELAKLLQKRSDLKNTSGFDSDTHYHVCDVIASASKKNGRFSSYIRDHLDALTVRFDLKYWPTLSEILQEIAADADAACTKASDPITSIATAAVRPSRADFCKALFSAIEEQTARFYGPLPDDFRLTDSTFASLVNCALNLGPENLVDGPYVKRLRQRTRDGAN